MEPSFVRGMERLVTAVQELSRARDVAAVQEVVRRAARELTGADGATFVLREGDRCFYADEDAIAPLWKGQRFPMSACISGWTMLNGRAAVIEDIYADARIPADAYRPTFVKSLVMVPVRSGEPVAAIGNYWATRHQPTDAEIRLLQALADSTAVALENASLNAELERRLRERTAALDAAARAEGELRHELAERQRAEAALRQTEHQLRHAQKMEAIGLLAGGIAHDFNNLLSVMLGFSSMAVSSLPPSDPLREDLEQVYRAGERAAALARRLLIFSRQQVVEPKLVDVVEITRGVGKMLDRIIGENMELEVLATDDPCPTLADPGQLEQVIMNLVVNARDAMEHGGKLTVEVSNVRLEAEYANRHLDVTCGDYVLLAVSDTGVGMSHETQARIFEPFFTTKEAGKGTGLGLSTVYGIVKQSGGHISVYSEPGHGTTMKVYLPRSTDAVATVTAAPPVTRLDGTESILVVEDDEQVRLVLRGILERHGYTVHEAAGPNEALAACRSALGIDVLLTDVIMPEMSAAELIDEVTRVRPGLRLICMSGYTAEAAVRRGVLERKTPFIQKPITPETLLTKLRQVLDAA